MDVMKLLEGYLNVVLGYGALGCMFLTALWLFMRERRAHSTTRAARIADLKEYAEALREEVVSRERGTLKNTIALKGLYGIIKRLTSASTAATIEAGDEES